MARVDVSFKLNYGGAGELLKSDSVEADLLERGERIAAAANALNLGLHVKRAGADDLEQVAHGVEVSSEPTRARARVRVRTATYQAMEDQLHHHTLQRALDAGR